MKFDPWTADIFIFVSKLTHKLCLKLATIMAYVNVITGSQLFETKTSLFFLCWLIQASFKLTYVNALCAFSLQVLKYSELVEMHTTDI